MAFGKGYIIGFATAICVVASLGVSGASMGLKPFQDVNRARAQQEKVLRAVGLAGGDNELSGQAITDTYNERIKVVVVDRSGAEVDKTLDEVEVENKAAKAAGKLPRWLVVYKRVDASGKAEAYALALEGSGLWGPLYGYLSIQPDMATVGGATFDAPKETPGLGAEIMNAKFQDQWNGKSVRKGGELVPVRVVKGEAKTVCGSGVDHCVDGVSGATITSRGVDAMVQAAITDYGPYLERLKK